ncbi:MAG: zinc ribbon domain-containing protein [Erysipelotrichaceae bacterium]|jgi:putative transposase|nr:zinc ribbon domain-containing protein [Erysipelotrichaceae bacterium]
MLEYKVIERNGFLIKVDTFYISSQNCHTCGYKNPAVKDLKARKWICPQCGAAHDRDQSAALNILSEGIGIFNEPQAAVSAARNTYTYRGAHRK